MTIQHDEEIEAIVERVSRLIGFLEMALKDLIRHGLAQGIGTAELEYHEVHHQIMSEIDRS